MCFVIYDFIIVHICMLKMLKSLSVFDKLICPAVNICEL